MTPSSTPSPEESSLTSKLRARRPWARGSRTEAHISGSVGSWRKPFGGTLGNTVLYSVSRGELSNIKIASSAFEGARVFVSGVERLVGSSRAAANIANFPGPSEIYAV